MTNNAQLLADGVGTPAEMLNEQAAALKQLPAEVIARFIDHTYLKPDGSQQQIETLCKEAIQHQFKSVCLNPCWISTAKERLENSGVKLCTVIGFPLGSNGTAVKAFEAATAIEQGANEIDMVMNVGALKSGDLATVELDMKEVVRAANQHALTKVIIETCLLTDEEKRIACSIAVQSGLNFVKTSTGFSTGGATVADVKLMRETVGNQLGVKASGGVRNLQDVRTMIASGATRIGTSAGVAIMHDQQSTHDY